ncbi:PTS system mannose/fructose/sorbose family transporter subunit IID [Desulfolutivibrio sulfoxidireducens]|uniref:PTS system mannose/fructose/sorbose family transporter subunit IID n=1 Tax=Desulfolutivibrio sulfoxidireducens TaxID=2773299 RepID=UPI00159E0133|nr:PTS system mannose/fructose/sorbose family transporter subunit IID [Desulfolutivibrio sulfoxidireducens]QLA17779.1 PTS cellobiose transporter subunit IIA [Desulfolutivibrio sulfoxidireducens]
MPSSHARGSAGLSGGAGSAYPAGQEGRGEEDVLRPEATPLASKTTRHPRRSLPGEPDVTTLCRTFFRSYLVAAAFNTRGLQNIGLAYAMEPGLRVIHPDPDAFGAAMKRHLEVYNSHPMWAPLLVGIFLSVEIKIAKGLVPATMLEDIKTTMAYTLSAVGDSFFGASLLGLWGLGAACLVASGHPMGVAVLAVCMLFALNVFKAATFWAGYREGFRVLKRLKRWDLINWGRRVKVVNAVMLTFLWMLAAPGAVGAVALRDVVIVSGLAAWALTEPRFPREMVFAALVATSLCLTLFRVS